MYSFTAFQITLFHFNTQFVLKVPFTTVYGLEEIIFVLQQLFIMDSSLSCNVSQLGFKQKTIIVVVVLQIQYIFCFSYFTLMPICNCKRNCKEKPTQHLNNKKNKTKKIILPKLTSSVSCFVPKNGGKQLLFNLQ